MSTRFSSSSLFMRLVILIAGGVALYFSNGRNAFILAAWIAPLLLLRFSRLTHPLIGFIALASVIATASYFMSKGMMPVPEAEYIVISLAAGIITALIYLADRLIARRLGGLIGSLVFPSLFVSIAWVLSFNPFGTWGHDAYVQYDFLPLIQVGSVTGLWGIHFLVTWFGSAMQTLWEEGGLARRLTAPIVYVSAFVGVIGFGMMRLMGDATEVPTVRLAALSNPPDMNALFFENCEEGDAGCRAQAAETRLDRLFDMSAAAADNGAEIILWFEGAAQFDAAHAESFARRAAEFSRASGTWLVTGVLEVPADSGALWINKVIAFSPQDGLVLEYLKAAPVPGEPIVKGNGEAKTLQTPFGTLGVLICFDADFPEIARRGADAGVDLMLVPANDWQAITPVHGEMAAFRAIENGYALARAASNGLSIAVDATGREIARNDPFKTAQTIMYADIPLASRHTVYSSAGDIFAPACLGLFLILTIASIAVSLTRRKST